MNSATPPSHRLTLQILLYGAGTLAIRAASYLLVPLYTRVFAPAEYALITQFYAWAALLQIVYTCGMETAYLRFSAAYQWAYGTATSALVISSLVFSALLVGNAECIASFLIRPGQARCVYYLAAILLTDTLVVVPMAQLRNRGRVAQFVLLKLFHAGLNLSLNLLFLLLRPRDMGIFGYFTALDWVFLSNVLASLALVLLMSQSVHRGLCGISWDRLKRMLSFALPLMAAGLAGTANEMLSRIMLQHWLPPGLYPGRSKEEVLGAFAACYKLASLMLLSIQSFRYAIEPFFLSKITRKRDADLWSQTFHWFVLGGCFVLFAIAVNLGWLSRLLVGSPKYLETIEVVPYLALAYLFWGICQVMIVWIKIKVETWRVVCIAMLGLVVNLALSALWVERMGYWGSVWATLASCVAMSTLCYVWVKKLYAASYAVRNKLGYIGWTLLCMYAARALVHSRAIPEVPCSLILTAIFGLLTYNTGCLFPVRFTAPPNLKEKHLPW